ncbi:uncharacterized protein VTP21DRAFT_8298 [Calcarisporiella thermophila]|uniref:uncharacterized protein n=1 Tax=Calcarisporiella thermophila TaxID=911321 RepID=UPI0037430466
MFRYNMFLKSNLVVLVGIAMAITVQAYELWYWRCSYPEGFIRKKTIEGDTCVALVRVDNQLCETVPHGSTGRKRYKESKFAISKALNDMATFTVSSLKHSYHNYIYLHGNEINPLIIRALSFMIPDAEMHCTN